MFKSMTWRVQLRSVGFAAGLAIVAMALTGPARATCMNVKTQAQLLPGEMGASHLMPAVYRPDALGGMQFLRVGDSDSDDEPSIVGLWQFKFSGFLVDWGTEAFHSDGTELIFSGGQNPETGDVCQGVWRKVGPHTYTLNHIAMGWLAPGAGFGIRVHVHMKIDLATDGNSFTGNYKVAVYSVSPADPFDESVRVASGEGKATAKRVKPD